MDDEQEMADQLVRACEEGFPGDRSRQIQQLSAHAAMAPIAYTGVFLRALNVLAERGSAETTDEAS